MLCLEDYLDALEWAKSAGGLPALQARADANPRSSLIGSWHRVDRLSRGRTSQRSNTSVCLKVVDPAVQGPAADKQAAAAKDGRPAGEGRRGYDIDAYRDAPSGLRIWCGATVERADFER